MSAAGWSKIKTATYCLKIWEIPAGAAVWLGINPFHQVEAAANNKWRGFAAHSNLWVCWCNTFEQRRFASEARLRGSTFALCVSVCEKQAQVKRRFCRRNEGSYPPPDEVRLRAVRRRGSSARSGEAKQKCGEMQRLQTRRSEKGRRWVTLWECFYTCTSVRMMWKRCDAFPPPKNVVSGVV